MGTRREVPFESYCDYSHTKNTHRQQYRLKYSPYMIFREWKNAYDNQSMHWKVMREHALKVYKWNAYLPLQEVC